MVYVNLVVNFFQHRKTFDICLSKEPFNYNSDKENKELKISFSVALTDKAIKKYAINEDDIDKFNILNSKINKTLRINIQNIRNPILFIDVISAAKTYSEKDLKILNIDFYNCLIKSLDKKYFDIDTIQMYEIIEFSN